MRSLGWGPHDAVSGLTRRGRTGGWMGGGGERERSPPAHTQERSCEDTVRRWSSASQEESSHTEPKWPPPWSWTSQLLELWEVHVCCLSHPVNGVL